MPDDEAPETPEVLPAEEAAAGAAPEEAAAPPPLSEENALILARIRSELGDGVLDHGQTFGNLVVRVAPPAWRKAAEVCRDKLGMGYLSFISGIDWQPAPKRGGEDAAGDTSTPAQPDTMTFGLTGSAGRFQVFASVLSVERPRFGVIFKTDVDESAMKVDSWVAVYPGADWHERECWEMFGVTFEGHPALRHLYLPSEFEGHPLRKDFPLLSREVKPWPGIVDVEPMPGEDPEPAATEDGGSGETPDGEGGGE